MPRKRETPRLHAESLQELGELFGVKRETAKGWRAKGAPKETLELGPWIRWFKEWKEQKTVDAGGAPTPASEKTLAEVRKLRAEVEAKERENAKAAGGLVDRQHVQEDLAALLIELRRAFQGLPAKVQQMLPAAVQHEVTKELKRRVSAALQETADRLEQFSKRVGKPPKGGTTSAE